MAMTKMPAEGPVSGTRGLNGSGGGGGGNGSGTGNGISLVPPDTRPEIHIGVDIARMVRQAIEALVDDPDTYVRGGALVHVARTPRPKKEAANWIPGGSPVIRSMTRATLRSRLSACANWRREKKGEAVACTPSESAVAAVLDDGSWPDVRLLIGLTETPMLRPDGTILQTPGYDHATGYLYIPKERYPNIPEAPTPADAADALAQLMLIFKDFPFSTDAGRMVPIAALLTLLARCAIDGSIPAIIVDASTKASGKSLLTDVLAIIATGRAAARTTYPEEVEELRKVLDGYALQGTPLVGIDNVGRPLGGSALDAYLTAHDTIDVRELGKTGQRTAPWRALIFATGNNVQYSGDTIRRVLCARIEPNCERPELRSDFDIQDLKNHVQRARPRLVAAVLTILRAFVLAGRPKASDLRWGSFEAWTELVPHAIVFAGGSNVLDARVVASAEHDPQTAALGTILELLPKLSNAAGGLRARDVASALYPGGQAPGRDAAPDGFDDFRDAIEIVARVSSGRIPGPRQIGEAFRKLRGRWIGDRRLMSIDDKHSKTARWCVHTATPPVGAK